MTDIRSMIVVLLSHPANSIPNQVQGMRIDGENRSGTFNQVSVHGRRQRGGGWACPPGFSHMILVMCFSTSIRFVKTSKL